MLFFYHDILRKGGAVLKRIIGFLIIIAAIPMLVFAQGEIVSELQEANTLKEQMTTSIVLTSPIHDIPVMMKDRNGDIFAEEYVEWRNPLSLSEIPLFAQQLFLESEDAEFYTHRGYNIAAIVRAFVVNAQSDDLKQGASTITQQLIRMQFLSTEKTYERKLTELFYAAELERQMTKDEILEMYLNEMYFGNRVYGIGAAATYYFSRPLHELNEAEIAFIAAIPNNPSLYDPIQNFEGTKKRQERLLDTLAKRKLLTAEETILHKETPIQLSLKKKQNLYPAYSTYMLAELEQLIGETEGFTKKIQQASDPATKKALQVSLKERTADVLSTGIMLETALNPRKQAQDEQALTSLLAPADLQAGAVVIDNATREIVSLYGGKDFFNGNFHRAFQMTRQPGSAIKPLLVYAPLFEHFPYSENTAVNSGPICIGSYCPGNVGGGVYGTTSIQEAFRHSHNTAAVRLFQMVGIERAFAHLDPFRFASISQQDMHYSAALGGFSKGVSPLELADAYTSFIDGMYAPAHAIRAVKDQEGNILYEWEKNQIEVWTPSTVTKIRNLMKDVVLNGSGRGVPYTTSYTGVKTGTTNAYKDLWTAGLNDRYTTAVWIGYDKPQSMKSVSDQKTHLKAASRLLKE